MNFIEEKKKTIYCLDCDCGQGTTAPASWWKKARGKFIKEHWGHSRVEGLPLLTPQQIVRRRGSEPELKG